MGGLRASVTLALLFALLRSGDATPASPGGYRISGVVVSTRSGAPVPYCRLTAALAPAASAAPRALASDGVRLVRPGGPVAGFTGPQGSRAGRFTAGSTSQNNRVEGKTDATGHFTLELPQAGAWQLSAEARGFRSQFYDDHEGYFSSVVLSDASPSYLLSFRLTPDSMIGGVVSDEAGDPVTRGQVVAELIPQQLPGQTRGSGEMRPRQVAASQTDDLGRYELLDLPPGEYRVRVQAQPWYASGNRGFTARATVQSTTVTTPDPSLDVVFATTWYPAASSEAEAETIRLAGGEERQADIHLTAIPAAHLVITRPESADPKAAEERPVQGQPLSITRVSSEGAFGQTSFVGGNARELDFGNLAPGTYELRLPGAHGDQDGEVRQVEVRPGSSILTLDQAVPLTRVDVAFEGTEGSPAVVFTDVETGRRISSSQPQRLRSGGRRSDGGEDDAGHQLFVMLPPKRYQLSVEGAGAAYVSSVSATGAKTVRTMVEIGGAPARLIVHLASGRGELAGRVRTSEGPDSGAMVLLVPATLGQPGDASMLLRDQSNTDGSFRMRSVTPGRYILVAVDHGWGNNWRTLEGLAKYLAGGTPVEVKAGDRLQEEIVAVMP